MKVTITFNKLTHNDVKKLYNKTCEFDGDLGYSSQYKFEVSSKEDKWD